MFPAVSLEFILERVHIKMKCMSFRQILMDTALKIFADSHSLI